MACSTVYHYIINLTDYLINWCGGIVGYVGDFGFVVEELDRGYFTLDSQ